TGSGQYCSPSPLSANSDAETKVAIPSGTGSGDLDFRIGQGTGAPWTDFFGTTHQLTCGPQNPCQIVVQLQVPNTTVFYSSALVYGAKAPGSDPPPTAAPVASGSVKGVSTAEKTGSTPSTTKPATSTTAAKSRAPKGVPGATSATVLGAS